MIDIWVPSSEKVSGHNQVSNAADQRRSVFSALFSVGRLTFNDRLRLDWEVAYSETNEVDASRLPVWVSNPDSAI